ncbi:hypothetical protein [Aquihabitans sp. McL0605]|uniref:hypothetical protein n=1 Tax=Aquihabitans sp. McL0605 TaxID=3415671 RepID=UPI003CF0BA35
MESGLRTPDTPGETGGLIVMVRPDPAHAARAIADDLHAELAIGGAETELALARLSARQLEHRDLDGLAAAMRRAELIRDRTRDSVSARLSKSLNTRVAIHPDTIRRAAIEVLAADTALQLAIAHDTKRTTRRRRLGTGAGTGVAAAGVAVAALAVPPVGVAIATVGVAGAGLSHLRARRATPAEHASLRQFCSVTRSRWEQVAGVGADPTQVDDIIHRYDPQDAVIAGLLGDNPAVRAAERVVVQRRMAWVAAWRREVGDSTPITDPAVQALLQRERTELWLTSGADLDTDQADTLVVAAPYSDLSEERAKELHRRLLGLPRGQRVIVVLAPDPDAPTGVKIPGVGWVPALEASPQEQDVRPAPPSISR